MTYHGPVILGPLDGQEAFKRVGHGHLRMCRSMRRLRDAEVDKWGPEARVPEVAELCARIRAASSCDFLPGGFQY